MTDNSKFTRQTVVSVHEWLPGKLFSLRTTRDAAFVYEPGQFARLGLPEAGADPTVPTLWRAYSMVGAPRDEALEFYSIVVPEGLFSPRLAALRAGDAIYVDKTPFGFLTLSRFQPARDLWLIATGTGLSAFLSMLREPGAVQAYERVIVVHGVRLGEELAYREEIEQLETQWSAQAATRLTYVPIASREQLAGRPQGRLTTLIENGGLERAAGQVFDPEQSRIMLCGNPAMLADARKLLGEKGFAPGRRGIPGNLAVENYW